MRKKSNFRYLASLVFASAFGVFLGITPLTSFGSEGASSGMMDVQYCNHNIDGNNTLSTFCKLTGCTHATGVGSNIGLCGSPVVGG